MTATDKQLAFIGTVMGGLFLAFAITAAAEWGYWGPLLGLALAAVIVAGTLGLLRLAERLFTEDS